jgi:hypothetical protein
MEDTNFWKSEPEVTVKRDSSGYAIGIRFRPQHADTIPIPFQRLLARVSSTLLIIKEALPPDTFDASREADESAKAVSGTPEQAPKGDLKRRRQLNTAVEALAAIARLGWQHGRVSEALEALEQFRDDFARRETSAIWARQLLESGAAAFVTTILLVALHFGMLQLRPGAFGQFENIDLVAAGAAIGFWVSHATAPQPLARFDHLPALQLERRASWIGLIFALLVSVIVGLLCVSGAVKITFGNFSTAIAESGQAASALLIGLLCGLVRPARVTARASAFVEAIEAEHRDPGLTELSHRVEDFLSEFPQRAADVWTRGEAGQALTRTMTDSVSQAMDTKLAALPDRTAEALTTNTKVKLSFEESVRAALEPPQPAKYQGHAVIQILSTEKDVDLIKLEDGRPSVKLASHGDYQLRIHFETGDLTTASGAEIPLMIEDGVTAANVPFELRIDIGFSREPRRRHKLAVPSFGLSEVFVFPFAVNGSTELEADYPMSITVYQHAVRWGTCLVWVSGPSAVT